jgi:hypothetical protein
MDKLQLTTQNLGRVFNSRGGNVYAMHSCGYQSKLPNLKLKTQPKQLLGSLPLGFALPGQKLYFDYQKFSKNEKINKKKFCSNEIFVQLLTFYSDVRFYLLNKVARFVTMHNYIFILKMSRSKLVSTSRPTVQKLFTIKALKGGTLTTQG